MTQQPSISSLFQTNSISSSSILKTICSNLKDKNKLTLTRTETDKHILKRNLEIKMGQLKSRNISRYQLMKFDEQDAKIRRTQIVDHDLELREYLNDSNKKFRATIKLQEELPNIVSSKQHLKYKIGKCKVLSNNQKSHKNKNEQFNSFFIKQNIKTEISPQKSQQKFQSNIKNQLLQNNPFEKLQCIRIQAITRGNTQTIQDLTNFKKMFQLINQKTNQKVKQLLKKQLKLPKLRKTQFKREKIVKGCNLSKIEARFSKQNIDSQNNIENVKNLKKLKKMKVEGRNSLKISEQTNEQSILRANALKSLK